jgi:hypothetical protein
LLQQSLRLLLAEHDTTVLVPVRDHCFLLKAPYLQTILGPLIAFALRRAHHAATGCIGSYAGRVDGHMAQLGQASSTR